MIYNRDIFISNIEKLITDKHGGYAAPFNRNIGQRDAVTRWKTGKFKPSLDVLLKITQLYGVSLNWLLTGEEPTSSQTESLDPISENPLNLVLQNQMTGLEKRFDEQKARIDDLAFHIKSLSETISEAFPALHKQVSVLQTETEEMRSALKEVGRTKDLEILGTIGGKS